MTPDEMLCVLGIFIYKNKSSTTGTTGKRYLRCSTKGARSARAKSQSRETNCIDAETPTTSPKWPRATSRIDECGTVIGPLRNVPNSPRRTI